MMIDFHTHLGDVVTLKGWEIIDQIGVKKKRIYDPIESAEKVKYNSYWLISDLLRYFLSKYIDKAEKARSATATLENMIESMKQAGVEKSVCMPIAPYVNFEELQKASLKEQRIILFTSIDFTKYHDFQMILDNDVSDGAKGLKLHPIIQKVSFEDKRTLEALEAFSRHDLPVLFHCGAQWHRRQDKKYAEYALPQNALKMVKAFPKVNFIIGHAGLYQVKEVLNIFPKYKNTYVDTSFQPRSVIIKLISAFGPNRVLFASDWPFGNRITNIETVEAACKSFKDSTLKNLIFFENAAELLELN